MNNYNINGKKVTQKQWYEHLEKLYLEQQPFAELGRLALTTRGTVCGSNDFNKFPNRCKNHCINYDYCKLRGELLAGEK